MTRASFRQLTTIRVGGPIQEFVRATGTDNFAEAVEHAWAQDRDWYILGSGSNTVVSEDGFAGIVIQDQTEELTVIEDTAEGVLIEVSAGYDWDRLVVRLITENLQGVETLSGIPGTVGAAPIQNIGAYGTELSEVLDSIEFLDAETGERSWLAAEELGLGYRTSAMKRGRRGAVLRVRMRLKRSSTSLPIAYDQLASRLEVEPGDTAKLIEVRQAVLKLRSQKGMLLDDEDPESRSAGSFFTNPIVDETVAKALPEKAPRWPVTNVASDTSDADLSTVDFAAEIPATGIDDLAHIAEQLNQKRQEAWQHLEQPQQVKLSAAWLIENSGISKGFQLPGSQVRVSKKHTLALVNAGKARGEEVSELARFIQSRVASEFGVVLTPEPNLLGLYL